MPKLVIRQCDGGKKGELCREITEKAFQNFFSYGVERIADACNTKRKSLIAAWQAKNPEAAMDEYDLSIPYRRGIEEITPPFMLKEPESVEVYLLEGSRSEVHPYAPMDITDISANEDFTSLRVNIYLDLIKYSGGNVRVPAARESVEELVYHELLHACGDVQYYGILRHNLIGIASVNELLRNKV